MPLLPSLRARGRASNDCARTNPNALSLRPSTFHWRWRRSRADDAPLEANQFPFLSASFFLRNDRLVRAAVLVLLYERPGRGGLRVLLTTRSKELRSHPGQTALPGGKVDQSDAGVVETAVRLSTETPTLPPLPLACPLIFFLSLARALVD